MKNRYKCTRGRRTVFVVARNVRDAETIARPLLNAPRTFIAIQYVGHA